MKISEISENWRKVAAESDKKSPDLDALSKSQLKDMLRRQEMLIANRKFMDSLPDKGQKIFDLREKLRKMIANKSALEETTSFLAKLSLKETVDPLHPTLTAKKLKDKETSVDIDVQSKANDERFDLYAVAIAETYKAELVDSYRERFVLNKPNKKEDNKSIDASTSRLKSVNYYEDTALKPLPVCKTTVKALSVTESLQLGNETKKKEQRLQQQLRMNKLGFTQQFQQRLRNNNRVDAISDSGSETNEINDDLD